MLSMLFSELGLSLDQVPSALKAMESDSQNGELCKKPNHKAALDLDWAEVDFVLRRVGSPLRSSMTMSQFRSVLGDGSGKQTPRATGDYNASG